MKKSIIQILFAILLLPYGFNVSAQTMVVTTRDGGVQKFPTADVQSVTFEDVAVNPFEITVSDITPVSAMLDIVCHDPDLRYYFDVCTRTDYERYGVKAIVESYYTSLQQQYPDYPLSVFLDGSLSQGDDSDEVSGLPVDTEMVCYAVGVDENGKCVGESAVKPFRTLTAGDPAECTFDISYDGVTSSQLMIYVKPSDPSVQYWMGCFAVSQWPGDITMTHEVKRTIDEYVEQNGMRLEDVVKGVTFMGDISMIESGFEPDTPYYIYVYAMDNEGNSASPMFKEVFTTSLYDYSNASVSLKYRYFDGTEMANAYPEKFANAAGRAVVQAVFTPNDECQDFVWALAKGDYTDESMFPDEQTKDAVIQGGFINTAVKDLIVDWGAATFLYFGADYDGIDGQLNRSLADFNSNGVSPASTYEDLSAAGATEYANSLMLRHSIEENRVLKHICNFKHNAIPKAKRKVMNRCFK